MPIFTDSLILRWLRRIAEQGKHLKGTNLDTR